MVELFSQNNWKVIMVSRNLEKLTRLQKENLNTESWPCDLSDKEAIKTLQSKFSDLPKLDCLVNNAGIFMPQSVDEDQDETWEKQFETNLMGPIRLTRLCWPLLKSSKGRVINISSTLAIRPIANTAAYSATKAAMNNWTQSLAIEGAQHGITANAICPGIVDTPIHSYVDSERPEDKAIYEQVQGAQPIGRTGKPQDIASMALHLANEEGGWMTGSILNIDGGILLNS